MTLLVRECRDDDERAAVNARYAAADVRFATTAPTDVQLVAHVDGVRVGMGRIVDFGDGHCELGGIYVELAARKHGAATAIVRALLERRGTRVMWCVPFSGLTAWYLTFGMERVDAAAAWHAKVAAKVDDCRARGLWPVDVLRVIG